MTEMKNFMSKKENMNKNKGYIVILALLMASLLSLSQLSHSTNYYLLEEDSQGNLREYYYELEPGLVADIVGDRWTISRKDNRQIGGLVQDFGNIVIYKLKFDTKVATEDFLAQASPGLAPVFSAPGGNYQIITGEVNVFFALDLAEDQVRDFFISEGISAKDFRPLSWGENGYQITTAPGLVALELANKLRIFPQVEKVYPNLWRNGYGVQ